MAEKEPMTHVWFKPCGCLSAAAVNVPNNFGEIAKLQRYANRHNERYELMETEAVRKMPWKCEKHKGGQDGSMDFQCSG